MEKRFFLKPHMILENFFIETYVLSKEVYGNEELSRTRDSSVS